LKPPKSKRKHKQVQKIAAVENTLERERERGKNLVREKRRVKHKREEEKKHMRRKGTKLQGCVPTVCVLFKEKIWTNSMCFLLQQPPLTNLSFALEFSLLF